MKVVKIALLVSMIPTFHPFLDYISLPCGKRLILECTQTVRMCGTGLGARRNKVPPKEHIKFIFGSRMRNDILENHHGYYENENTNRPHFFVGDPGGCNPVCQPGAQPHSTYATGSHPVPRDPDKPNEFHV